MAGSAGKREVDTPNVARMASPAAPLLSMHVPAMPEPSSSFIDDFAGSLVVHPVQSFLTSGANARALEMNSNETIAGCKQYRGIVSLGGLYVK